MIYFYNFIIQDSFSIRMTRKYYIRKFFGEFNRFLDSTFQYRSGFVQDRVIFGFAMCPPLLQIAFEWLCNVS